MIGWGFRYKMIDEIKSKKADILRWHDSGDFMSPEYLEVALDIARATPNVIHYAYTKMISNVKGSEVPPNFHFTFSVDDEAPENDLIDLKNDKHSIVVPVDVTKDLTIKNKDDKKVRYRSDEDKDEVKNRISKRYNVPKEKLVTYDELTNSDEIIGDRKYVIVLPKEGDMGAVRKDILGIFLIMHK